MSAADLPPKGVGRPDPPAFGRGLARGLGVNLLVSDVERALAFQVPVLGAEVVYWDDDFAVLTAEGSVWMLHHDRTYHGHPLRGIAEGAEGRGAGAELRLYGRDPDVAEALAEANGGTVLAGAADKPHGLREAYLLDPDGYLWVPSVPSG
jgi:catechol 2,3-dioxygenase-like lactoylglutathione lyase family enzyme